MGIEVGASMEKDHRETITVGVLMTRKIKVRWNEHQGPGVIQIRAVTTAGVHADVFVTEDQLYGIVEAIKNDSLPAYRTPRGTLRKSSEKWREL